VLTAKSCARSDQYKTDFSYHGREKGGKSTKICSYFTEKYIPYRLETAPDFFWHLIARVGAEQPLEPQDLSDFYAVYSI
jgi:hypothetical protein